MVFCCSVRDEARELVLGIKEKSRSVGSLPGFLIKIYFKSQKDKGVCSEAVSPWNFRSYTHKVLKTGLTKHEMTKANKSL